MNNEKTPNFKSYISLADETVAAAVATTPSTPSSIQGKSVEKQNILNGKKYSIDIANANNMIVKKILDTLLTEFVSNKLASDSEGDVLKLLTSNQRNPYLIWDNSTRAQLADFLEYQRTKSSKERYEDVMDVHELVADFSYDAHRLVFLLIEIIGFRMVW